MIQETALELVERALINKWLRRLDGRSKCYKYYYFLEVSAHFISGILYYVKKNTSFTEHFSYNSLYFWDKLTKFETTTEEDQSIVRKANKELTKYFLKH